MVRVELDGLRRGQTGHTLTKENKEPTKMKAVQDMRKSTILSVFTLAFSLSCGLLPAQASNHVVNSSLEKGKFVNGGGGYMVLPNLSAAITGWTVVTSAGAIAWARNGNADGVSASAGRRCVDLTGLSNSATNGEITQTVTPLTPNRRYRLSLDAAMFNDGPLVVKIDNTTVPLTAGTPFTVGTTTWVPMTGTYVATSNTTPVLEVINAGSGNLRQFIDDIKLMGP
jgi:hypothetical protein